MLPMLLQVLLRTSPRRVGTCMVVCVFAWLFVCVSFSAILISFVFCVCRLSCVRFCLVCFWVYIYFRLEVACAAAVQARGCCRCCTCCCKCCFVPPQRKVECCLVQLAQVISCKVWWRLCFVLCFALRFLMQGVGADAASVAAMVASYTAADTSKVTWFMVGWLAGCQWALVGLQQPASSSHVQQHLQQHCWLQTTS